jgi:uncharacterized protein YprB with RNaseH-like and TPR domain
MRKPAKTPTPTIYPFDDDPPRTVISPALRARTRGYLPKKPPKAGFRCLCLDIETTNLNADYGVVLCAAMSRSVGRIQVLSQRTLNPDWGTSSLNDRPVLERLLAEMAQADFWIAHNGAAFDLPFLYARAAYWGLPTPPKRALLDPVVVSRRHYRLSGNSLENLAKYFNLPPKTPLLPNDWMSAALARDNQAMRRIERHCRRDVEILTKLAPHFRGLWRHLGSTGSFY